MQCRLQNQLCSALTSLHDRSWLFGELVRKARFREMCFKSWYLGFCNTEVTTDLSFAQRLVRDIWILTCCKNTTCPGSRVLAALGTAFQPPRRGARREGATEPRLGGCPQDVPKCTVFVCFCTVASPKAEAFVDQDPAHPCASRALDMQGSFGSAAMRLDALEAELNQLRTQEAQFHQGHEGPPTAFCMSIILIACPSPVAR